MNTPDRQAETLSIRIIEREDFDESALGRLLADAVASGASLGFLPPLAPEEAKAYWVRIKAEVGRGRLLLGAYRQGRLVGSVQLALEDKANGRHRAEVQKLMVLRQERRRGIGAALMTAVELAARDWQRTLLVLDTAVGGGAEGLYERQGYRRVGEIPGFALGADGDWLGTVVFYKTLA